VLKGFPDSGIAELTQETMHAFMTHESGGIKVVFSRSVGLQPLYQLWRADWIVCCVWQYRGLGLYQYIVAGAVFNSAPIETVIQLATYRQDYSALPPT
jgi:hypothetical protein